MPLLCKPAVGGQHQTRLLQEGEAVGYQVRWLSGEAGFTKDWEIASVSCWPFKRHAFCFFTSAKTNTVWMWMSPIWVMCLSPWSTADGEFGTFETQSLVGWCRPPEPQVSRISHLCPAWALCFRIAKGRNHLQAPAVTAELNPAVISSPTMDGPYLPKAEQNKNKNKQQ